MKRRLTIAFTAVVTLAWIVALSWDPVMRWLIAREAEKHGVVVTIDEVAVGWESVEMRNVGFALVGVDTISWSAKRLTLTIDGFEPKRVDVSGVSASADGNATDLILDLTTWAKEHPTFLSLPFEARHVDVTWRPIAGGDVWLDVDDAHVRPTDSGGKLTAEKVTVIGFDIGKIGAVWRGDSAKLDVGLGADELASAPITAEVEHALAQPTATVTLRQTALKDLAAPLAMLLPVDGVTLAAIVKLSWDAAGIEAPISGHLSAQLKGYRPPAPIDARELIFGDDTAVETDLAIDAERRHVKLDALQIKHGAVILKGGGAVVRHDGYAVADVMTEGNVSCQALAMASARARIGGLVGDVASIVGGTFVAGSVGVKVGVHADTRALADAKITRDIGIGCRLTIDRILRGLPAFRLPQLP